VRQTVGAFDAHLRHEGRHMLAANSVALLAQQIAQHAATGERMIQVQFVDPTHKCQVGRRCRSRHVVHRGAREPQKLRLASNRKSVLGIDHRFALASSIRPSAMDKKSFSMVSCPIFACRSLMLGPSWAFCLSPALANTWAT